MNICWLYQKHFDWRLDEGRAVSPWGRRHLQVCPTCRQYYQEQVELAQRLASEAERACLEPPPFLYGRIVTAIDRYGEPALPREAVRLNWAAPLAAAGVALAIALVILKPANPSQLRQQATANTLPNHPQIEQANTPSPTLAMTLSQLPPEFKQWDGTTLLEWSQTLQRPLQEEIQSVLHDATSAVQVLAQNFLPDNP